MPLAQLVDVEPGGFTEVEAEVDGTTESVILHRAADDAARAWLNVCPHAGRRLDWAPGKFLLSKEGQLVCAVHVAAFETMAVSASPVHARLGAARRGRADSRRRDLAGLTVQKMRFTIATTTSR